MHLFWYHSNLNPSLFRCTDYKRQECRNKWVFFCNSRSTRTKRSSRVGRLFWDKISRKDLAMSISLLKLFQIIADFFNLNQRGGKILQQSQLHQMMIIMFLSTTLMMTTSNLISQVNVGDLLNNVLGSNTTLFVRTSQ